MNLITFNCLVVTRPHNLITLARRAKISIAPDVIRGYCKKCKPTLKGLNNATSNFYSQHRINRYQHFLFDQNCIT
jgi:RNase P subunit RPR2